MHHVWIAPTEPIVDISPKLSTFFSFNVYQVDRIPLTHNIRSKEQRAKDEEKRETRFKDASRR